MLHWPVATTIMRRRDLITGFAGALASLILSPPRARAQPPARSVVGILFGAPSNTSVSQMAVQSVREGLQTAGFAEGRDVAIEIRWAEGQYDRLPALAAELVDRPVAVLVAVGAPAAAAAKAAMAGVPVVFYVGEDPVSLGLVPRLNRPGGNVTGVAYLSSAVLAKRMEMLRELVPKARVIAALINPKNPNVEISTKDIQAAARSLGQRVHVLNASTTDELDAIFARLAELKAGALLIAPDGFFNTQAGQLAALATRHGMPASHEIGAFAAAGGLMSYGGSIAEGLRQTGAYAGRILTGEKPATMPVMQPTKFELVINLNSAKALGLAVPPSIILRADKVIE
jgi:putative tryptophan/tyrosine transport system substrate-binding protein